MIAGVMFKGDVKDACARLKAEAERCKGMTVSAYLRLLQIEEIAIRQIEEIQKQVLGGRR